MMHSSLSQGSSAEVRFDPSLPTKPSEVLERAAELINTYGWVRGMDHAGSASCAYGAIDWAARGVINPAGWSIPPSTSLTNAIREIAMTEMRSYLSYGIIPWNDEIVRRKSQVVKGLKKAAKQARKQGR